MKMKETAKETARQRKIYMILIIILIIVLTVLGGGYYFMMQTKAASQKTSGKNSDDQSQTSQTSGSDTLEYKGGIYKYNDHLSNYLFLGIHRYFPYVCFPTIRWKVLPRAVTSNSFLFIFNGRI